MLMTEPQVALLVRKLSLNDQATLDFKRAIGKPFRLPVARILFAEYQTRLQFRRRHGLERCNQTTERRTSSL